MSSLKRNQNLLQENNILKTKQEDLIQENLQLKRQQNLLNFQTNKVMEDLNKKMDLLLTSFNELKSKGFNVIGNLNNESSKNIDLLEDDKPMFIPTVDTSDIKRKISTVDKKNRKTNLKNVADKLSSLEKEGN